MDKVNISKSELEYLYKKRRLSTWKIEKELKISRGTIYRKLKNYSIPIRNRSDSHVIHKKSDFSGDNIEKSYLIGFRIGDLGVRKQYENSKTICVATGSTIKEQIFLVQTLFEKYSKVWVKQSKNKINTQVILNNSFDFLLSKKVPKWVEENKPTFFSFLAGFSDAEGTISMHNQRAYYSLGNYDQNLLISIHKNLNKFGIVCKKPTHDNRKGKFNNQGYVYRSNYWTLRLHKKKYLLMLLKEMRPYLKHEKKVLPLNKAISNIEYRNKVYGESRN